MKYYRLLWETLGRQRWWHSVPRRRIRITVPVPPATSRALLLSLTAVCNANKMRDCDIADTKLKELSKEMRDLETLKAATLMCKHCKKRLLIDKPIGNKIYCQCENNKAVEDETSGWQPFLETEDIVIWRKEEQPGNGLYAYKVYGRYPEVTAEDFLAMHTDLSYWRSWDETALSLKTLSQPIGHRSQQDVIHWETLWPRFFANRDYVYVRRYAYMDSDLGANPVRPIKSKFGPTPRNTSYTNDATIKDFASDKAEDDTSKSSSEKAVNGDKASHGDDHVSKQRILGLIDDAFGTSNYLNRNVEALGSARKESKGVKVIVMTSQSCEHPDAPVTKKAHRVTRYWSNLVIKPFTEIDKPGIEFSLTYFDDPGTSIPSALQTWVAGHACPDFLARMRVAAASYRDTRHQQAPSVEEILNKAKEKETKEEEIPSPVHTEMPQAVVGEEKGDTPPVVEQAEGNRQSHEDEPISLKSYLPEEPLSTEKDSAKAKSDRETQEFLDLLNGRKTDESPPVSVEEVSLDTDKQIGDATDDRTMEKVKSEDPVETNKKDDFRVNERLKDISLDQGHDLQTKEVSQASYNGYWRIWPLYYFA